MNFNQLYSDWNESHLSIGVISLKTINNVINDIKNKEILNIDTCNRLSTKWLINLIELNTLPLIKDHPLINNDNSTEKLVYNNITYPKVNCINGYYGIPQLYLNKPVSCINSNGITNISQQLIYKNNDNISNNIIINKKNYRKKNRKNNDITNQSIKLPIHGLKLYIKAIDKNNPNDFYWHAVRVVNYNMKSTGIMVTVRSNKGIQWEIDWSSENIQLNNPYSNHENEISNHNTIIDDLADINYNDIDSDDISIDNALNNLLELEDEVNEITIDSQQTIDQPIDIFEEDYIGYYDQNVLTDIENYYQSLSNKKIKFVVKSCYHNKIDDIDLITIHPDEDPLGSIEDPDITIIGQYKQFIKRKTHWKVKLHSAVLLSDNKEYVFPIVTLIIDISNIFDIHENDYIGITS